MVFQVRQSHCRDPHAFNIVDDILVVGRMVDELMNHIDAVMRHCKKHGIDLPQKKFEIAKGIRFAAYWVTNQGTEPYDLSLIHI